MLNPKDISNYNNLTKDQKRSLEKTMQETDLDYLSSVAFEQFSVSNSEIDSLNQLIDKKTKGGSPTFNTIFISVLCGLLIGVSIFFVIFQKNKNHPSVYQSVDRRKSTSYKLENNISCNLILYFQKLNLKNIEHYNTIADHVEGN
jgi:hypothetical protein